MKRLRALSVALAGACLAPGCGSDDLLPPGPPSPSPTIQFLRAPTYGEAEGLLGRIEVAVWTAQGNPDSTPVAVRLTLGANPAGALLSGRLEATATNGLAVFDSVSIDRVGVGYTLVASAAGFGTATSAPFNIEPPTGPPTPLRAAPGPR